jgi:hypothetical protein
MRGLLLPGFGTCLAAGRVVVGGSMIDIALHPEEAR